MKLAVLVLASLLALPTLADAEERRTPGQVVLAPGGPVQVEDADVEDDVDVRPANWQGAPGAPQQGPDRERQRQRNRALKAALMAHFDLNGDGRLGPRERMRAARVLAKVARKLAGPGMQGRAGKQGRVREKIIRRFDTNGDGSVDPSEIPPGAARKLRRFDRDRDGWVEPGELR